MYGQSHMPAIFLSPPNGNELRKTAPIDSLAEKEIVNIATTLNESISENRESQKKELDSVNSHLGLHRYELPTKISNRNAWLSQLPKALGTI